MSVGAGFNKSKSTSRSWSKPVAWKWQQEGLKDLNSQFRSLLSNYGFQGILSEPVGIVRSIYENLFGESPAGDFLGARKALEESLSGEGLQKGVNTAMNTLLPWMTREGDIMRQNLLQKMGHTGTRFSTDFGNILESGMRDLALQTQGQALNVAVPWVQTRAGLAKGIYDLVSGMAEQQINRQVPLWAQLLTAYAPIGSFGRSRSRSLGANVRLGLSGGSR